MFSVVKFLKDNEVEVVSSKWIHTENGNSMCYWPEGFKSLKLKKAVLGAQEPEKSWIAYDVGILGTYDSYLTARQKLRLAEDTSNLDSSDNEEQSRKRRCFSQQQQHHYYSSDEEILERTSKNSKVLPKAPQIKYSNFENNSERADIASSQGFSNTPNVSPVNRALLYSPVHTQQNSHAANTNSLHQFQVPPSPPAAFQSSQLPHGSSHQYMSSNDLHWSRFNNASPAEKHLFRMMDKVLKNQEEQRTLGMQMMAMLAGLKPESKDTSPSSQCLPQLPLANLEAFEAWEVFLQTPENFKLAVEHVSYKGGSTTNETTRRVMKAIFTYSLASQMN